MKSEELDELERLLGEATPGPWGIAAPGTAESPFVLAYGDGDSLASFEPCGPWVSPEQAFADLSVTAALRNAAPALLLAARENAALHAENRSLVQTLCDEVNKATEDLRARLEKAERVVGPPNELKYLVGIVQYRGKKDNSPLHWLTMAAFDSVSMAETYAENCSKDNNYWEYRAIALAAYSEE